MRAPRYRGAGAAGDDVIVTRDHGYVLRANLTGDDFFSSRIGCQVFQPIYGMDLGALCRRR
jgi:hypothetical protein